MPIHVSIKRKREVSMTTYKIILPSTAIPDFYSEAIKEYTKRLSRYCHIEVQHIDSVKNLNTLIEGFYCFKVSTKGKSMTSEGFSELLEDLSVRGHSKVAFIINLKTPLFDDTLSLTSLDLSNGMSLTCLLEQLYRGYKISKNEPYHK